MSVLFHVHLWRRIVFCGMGILFGGVAVAQPANEINISSPSVTTIKKSLADRFDRLRDHFETGAIGFTHDGMIALRDAQLLAAESRAAIDALISDDNQDRATLYREIARVNGRPDWEANLRKTFAERWIHRAPPGWFYRESGGKWIRK